MKKIILSASAIFLSACSGVGMNVERLAVGTTSYIAEVEKTRRREKDKEENLMAIAVVKPDAKEAIIKSIIVDRPKEVTPNSPYEDTLMERIRQSVGLGSK